MKPVTLFLTRVLVTTGCLACGIGLSSRANGEAIFRGLGVNTYAYEVAGNGSKVVGDLGDPTFNPTAGYWSPETGWVSLDWSNATIAYAVSGDGSVITGYSISGSTNGDNKAYRWTAATGGIVLPSPAQQGLDISADGTTIVGAWGDDQGQHPFRYTSSGGTVDMSAVPGMPSNAQARGVSGNGDLIAGSSSSGAWLWNASANSVQILSTANTNITPSSLSANGTTIVGNVAINGQTGAGYWRANEGIVRVLPRSAGGDTSARDVTADGSMITGYYYPDGQQRAWIWDQIHGVRRVEDMLLQDYGLNVGNWRLRWAHISDDGKTLAGAGFNPAGAAEAWVAVVPEPATLMPMGLAAVILSLAHARRKRRRNVAATVGCVSQNR